MTNKFKVSIFGVLLFLIAIVLISPNKALAEVPANYSGCAGVSLSSCSDATYDIARCFTFTTDADPGARAYFQGQADANGGCIPNLGGDPCYTVEEAMRNPWNDLACQYQQQGCFVPHPELTGSNAGGGVCVPPRQLQDYSCAHRPESPVCGSEFSLCYDYADLVSAGTIPHNCSCSINFTDSQGQGRLCLFRDQADMNAQMNYLRFTDDHCPVCPDGFSASSADGLCWPEEGDIGDTVAIVRFDDCNENQRCASASDGAGCEEVLAGGCQLASSGSGVPERTCGGDVPFSCTVGSDMYCCETQGQCVAAGGQQTMCIRTGDLTQGDFSATSCYSLYPTDFPQLCQVDRWNGPTLNQEKYCCFNQSSCDALGGQEQGIVNNRPSGQYDVCSANLAGQGGALDLCNSCFAAQGIWTAVGCISQDPKDMIGKLVNIGIGILGGIFLLRVLAAGFTLTISQGDVKKTTEAKEMITESVIGVLFILFSVTILQFIGSGVLKIPGFG